MAHGELVMIGAYTAVLSGIWLDRTFLSPFRSPSSSRRCSVSDRARRRPASLWADSDTLLATWGIAHPASSRRSGWNSDCPSSASISRDLAPASRPYHPAFSQCLRDRQLHRPALPDLHHSGNAGPHRADLVPALPDPIGIQVRAIMRNPAMAAACGIDVKRVSAMTFAFGSGLAGVAGVMMAGFKSVVPDMGRRWWSTASWWWSSAVSAACSARSPPPASSARPTGSSPPSPTTSSPAPSSSVWLS